MLQGVCWSFSSADKAIIVGLSRTDPDADYKSIEFGIGKKSMVVYGVWWCMVVYGGVWCMVYGVWCTSACVIGSLACYWLCVGCRDDGLLSVWEFGVQVDYLKGEYSKGAAVAAFGRYTPGEELAVLVQVSTVRHAQCWCR
jgi:hypothetical protein